MSEQKVCACHEQAKELKADDYPYKCPTIPGRVHVQCKKCHERIALDFGSLTKEDAEKALRDVALTPGECPGYHVEFSMWTYWQCAKALEVAFAN